jgi:predicted anti-sigma-YlaC factor YlaD
MRCQPCREALSARLDGEAPGIADELVEVHLRTCAPCRSFATGAEGINRRTAVRPVEAVPDLTGPILAAADLPRPASAPAVARTAPASGAHWGRWALLAVALTQLLLAVPTLVGGREGEGAAHLARELGAWDVALAAALLWVVFRPERAAGLVPFVAMVGLAMVATATLDVVAGRADALAESRHVLELVGLALLVVVARNPGDREPLLDGLRRGRPALAAS